MIKKILILSFILVNYNIIANAQIFKWVDEKGVVNYTDDYSNIPKKYIKNVEKIDVSINNSEINKDKQFSGESKKKNFEQYKDTLGRGEDYWRNRVNELRNRIIKVQETIEFLRGKYNKLTEKYNESKSSIEKANLRRQRDSVKDEMEKYKKELEEVRITLDQKIPEEAELYKAKPEWIK